jgi:hypothetical protein
VGPLLAEHLSFFLCSRWSAVHYDLGAFDRKLQAEQGAARPFYHLANYVQGFCFQPYCSSLHDTYSSDWEPRRATTRAAHCYPVGGADDIWLKFEPSGRYRLRKQERACANNQVGFSNREMRW